MPDPPRSADLKARIIAQINRDGFSVVTYAELREAWPEEFASAAQFALISGMAADEDWEFSYLPGGIRFTRRAK